MKRYTIRGLVQPTTENDIGLRVEAWDADREYDDLLDAALTDTSGVFEVTFDDDDFQQEPSETEPTPDLYFKVFRGEELLGKTEINPNFSLAATQSPRELNISFALTNPIDQSSSYKMLLQQLWTIEQKLDTDRDRFNFREKDSVQVVDVLPSLDQIQQSGRMTSVSNPTNPGSDLQGIVEGALGTILGSNLRTDDPKNLVNTLTQTFTARQVDGRTVYDWNPRSVAVRASDLGGGITGAQASLYHRAKTAIQDGIQLLNSLYPLKSAADKENMEATRAIVRTEMQELLAELGARGGPRILRVDNLFQLLLGEEFSHDLSNNGNQRVGGQLKKLMEYFGLLPSQINTVEEEQNFSNFLTLKDYLQSLQRSWLDYKRSQNSNTGAYIGTQLVRLAQALAVVGESVQEVYRIMELFFLGPEERLSVYIDFTRAQATNLSPDTRSAVLNVQDVAFPLPDGTAYLKRDVAQLRDTMTVEGLLNWICRFATEEGPLLAKSGGKLGIQVIAETSDRLMILTQAASYTPIPNAAFRREGVIRALRDLASQLYQVRQLAEQVKLPAGEKPDDLDFALTVSSDLR